MHGRTSARLGRQLRDKCRMRCACSLSPSKMPKDEHFSNIAELCSQHSPLLLSCVETRSSLFDFHGALLATLASPASSCSSLQGGRQEAATGQAAATCQSQPASRLGPSECGTLEIRPRRNQRATAETDRRGHMLVELSFNLAARHADPARPSIAGGTGMWPLQPGRQFRPGRAWRSDLCSGRLPAPASPTRRDRGSLAGGFRAARTRTGLAGRQAATGKRLQSCSSHFPEPARGGLLSVASKAPCDSKSELHVPMHLRWAQRASASHLAKSSICAAAACFFEQQSLQRHLRLAY